MHVTSPQHPDFIAHNRHKVFYVYAQFDGLEKIYKPTIQASIRKPEIAVSHHDYQLFVIWKGCCDDSRSVVKLSRPRLGRWTPARIFDSRRSSLQAPGRVLAEFLDGETASAHCWVQRWLDRVLGSLHRVRTSRRSAFLNSH
jgi:hypothetical protein